MRTEMFNEQNGKSTELVIHQINFNTGLSDNDFNQGTLKNVR
jgi:outer membrane lipoprotein-sorting protein